LTSTLAIEKKKKILKNFLPTMKLHSFYRLNSRLAHFDFAEYRTKKTILQTILFSNRRPPYK